MGSSKASSPPPPTLAHRAADTAPESALPPPRPEDINPLARGLAHGPGDEVETVGAYHLLEELGEGGHGVVYRARHQKLGTQVALKMVRVRDPSLLAGIRREIFALRTVEHPCVTRIVDDGIHEGHPWYAMELIGGDTLTQYIDRLHDRVPQFEATRSTQRARTEPTDAVRALGDTEIPPSPWYLDQPRRVAEVLEEIVGVMRALCSPLAFVHGEGLVHRDLKPDNVVLNDDGAPVLVDFGLALRFAGVEPSRDVVDVAGRSLGTPPYMAPEQIRGDIVDARTDLYALGCILYECITGTVPFDGAPSRVLRMHLSDQPEPPSRRVEGVPSALDELVLRLLQKKPRHRLGFAVDVERALAALGCKTIGLPQAPPSRPYLYRPRLAGRARLLGELEAVEPLARQRACLSILVGQSGVGKTRLAMELASRASRRGVAVVAGQCSLIGGPLHPIRPLLTHIVDDCQSLSPAEVQSIVGDHAAVLGPHEPGFCRLPGREPSEPPPELPVEAARERLMSALTSVISHFTSRQAVLFVVDDLQWADELTFTLLDRLGSAVCDLTVVATVRSEERTAALDALCSAPHALSFELGPLDHEAVSQMVGDMLALDDPPRTLVHFLHQESEGNPFFIAEYLRTAVGEGVITRDESGRWAIEETGRSPDSLRQALPLPEGLRDLVRRRIGALDDDARRLVETAAVLGRRMDGDVLTAAVGLASVRARRALELLRARQVLEEAEQGALRFVHDKLREIVYGDIDECRLPALHASAAFALERGPEEPAGYPMLAHHYRLAGQRREALRYYERAGEHALASAAWQEARGHFEQALALAGEETDSQAVACWQRRLGVSCYSMGELGKAELYLTRSLEGLAVRRAFPGRRSGRALEAVASSVEALAGQAARLSGLSKGRPTSSDELSRYREAALAAERLSQVHYFKSEPLFSFSAALECARYAEQLGPSPELARAYATLSVAFSAIPISPARALYGRKAEGVAREVGDPHATTWVAFMRGLTAIRAGHHREARRFLSRALAMALESGDVRHGQEIQMLIAQAYSMGGERRRALEQARKVLDWARQTRSRQAELWARGAIAKNLTDLGNPNEALASYRENQPLSASSDDESSRMAEAYAALAHAMRGDWAEAQSVADGLIEGGRQPGSWHACLGYVGAGEIYSELMERDGSSKALRDGLTRVCRVLARARHVFRSFGPHAAIFEGRAAWDAGRHKAARRAWQRALQRADALDLPAERARAHFELARHDAPGARRKHHLGAAIHWFERVEAQHWLTHARALQGGAEGP